MTIHSFERRRNERRRGERRSGERRGPDRKLPPAIPVLEREAAALPPRAPLAMPLQSLRQKPARQVHAHSTGSEHFATALARLIAFGSVIALGFYGWREMRLVFGDDVTRLQSVLLVLFTITFVWIGFTLSGLVAGLFARRFGRRDLPPAEGMASGNGSAKGDGSVVPSPADTADGATTDAAAGSGRIAIVMPIYHEDAAESLGLLAGLADELAGSPLAERVEFFVASDSRRPEMWLTETRAVHRFRQMTDIPVWYRRREANIERKAGNIADVIRNYGARYEYMLVLDADSIVSADTLTAMVSRMSADPGIGMIQTMPTLVGGETLFARFIQFAGYLYGRLVARGVSAWSGNSGNYWGHNALMRTAAFAASCGLPQLRGPRPIGGSILSHDFVEAALMRRAGWKVQLHHDLDGSYEGSPPTLLDNAVRERRWAQGNLQHTGVLAARGLKPVSRVHLLLGICSYLMSLVWLALIGVGMGLTANVLLSRPEYFPSTYQLFPDWPVFDNERMLWLFAVSMGLLFLPKIIGLLRAMFMPGNMSPGARLKLLPGWFFELLLSILISPVQMLMQTRQVIEILLGHDSGWEAQVRAGDMPPWRLVLWRHAPHFIGGGLLLGILWILDPTQLLWLAPIIAGLLLSPLTSRWTASPRLGACARQRGLFVTPEERNPPFVLTQAAAHAEQFREGARVDALLDTVLDDPQQLAAHLTLLPSTDDTSTSAHADDARPIAAPEESRDDASNADNDEDLNARLPLITANAKVAHATSRHEALAILDEREVMALFGNAELLQTWARLPSKKHHDGQTSPTQASS
ncbi:MAG: glucans biosynthesis glucosyltransferase MdoH [Gammaproteobacteria bacterium]|nr:MAG: glucans biosynthesis glucosyltransferase MdoH [Gammaproteobacteria bacterium]